MISWLDKCMNGQGYRRYIKESLFFWFFAHLIVPSWWWGSSVLTKQGWGWDILWGLKHQILFIIRNRIPVCWAVCCINDTLQYGPQDSYVACMPGGENPVSPEWCVNITVRVPIKKQVPSKMIIDVHVWAGWSERHMFISDLHVWSPSPRFPSLSWT